LLSRAHISIKRLLCFWLHTLQHWFLSWTRPPKTSLLLGTVADLARGKSELVAENALLRHQLIILRRQITRPMCTRRDRILFVLLARTVRTWRQALLIVQPETLLRWHRQGFRLFWRDKSKAISAKPKVVSTPAYFWLILVFGEPLKSVQESGRLLQEYVAGGGTECQPRPCFLCRRD
jgi:hypothetical protein